MRASRVAARSSLASTSPRTPGSRREAADAQDALGTVGLQIGAPDEAVAGEQRQDVVAVHALVLALVHLDHVPEAEHALEQRPVPDEVVERADEHRRRGSAAELGAGDVERRAAVAGLHLAQPAFRRRARARWWCSRALPPSSRQCSRIAASVSAPRAPTASSANVRSVSSSVGGRASSSCFGITRSARS